MKFLIVLVAIVFVATTCARPSQKDSDVSIVKSESDVQPDYYKYVAETSDGTKREEEGVLKDVGSEHDAIVVHGSYSWKDEKTGQEFTVTYVADENGFQPIGDHIPKVEGVH